MVRTPSGAANYLASALDHANEPDILGTIAGDDTIMIITSGPLQSRALVRRLLALAGSREDDPIPETAQSGTASKTRPTSTLTRPTTGSHTTPSTTPQTRPVVIQTKNLTKETQ